MNTAIKEFDVVVIGAGPGGLSAALSAARNGARVLLVEKNGYLGGNMAIGLKNCLIHKAEENAFGKRCRSGFLHSCLGFCLFLCFYLCLFLGLLLCKMFFLHGVDGCGIGRSRQQQAKNQ